MLPPTILETLDREIHVWRFTLDQSQAITDRVRSILSPEERQRADRFRADLHRGRFVVGRGSMRAILGSYLGVAPESLSFRVGDHGKPSLEDADGFSPLQFNLAHSDSLAVLAVTRHRSVGIDLERLRTVEDAGSIVDRFFSDVERSAYHSLPSELQPQAFVRCWTRKEAYLKATGAGLSAPLDRFDVALGPDAPAGLLRVEAMPDEPARWTFRDLSVGPDYFGSLAVEGSELTLHEFEFDPLAPLKMV